MLWFSCTRPNDQHLKTLFCKNSRFTESGRGIGVPSARVPITTLSTAGPDVGSPVRVALRGRRVWRTGQSVPQLFLEPHQSPSSEQGGVTIPLFLQARKFSRNSGEMCKSLGATSAGLERAFSGIAAMKGRPSWPWTLPWTLPWTPPQTLQGTLHQARLAVASGEERVQDSAS